MAFRAADPHPDPPPFRGRGRTARVARDAMGLPGTGILPFRFRLPLTRQLLRFGDLCRGHLPRDAIPIADRIRVTSRSRHTEPHVCVNIVLRHAQSGSVTEAKIDLRSNMTLVCSAAKPLRSLDPVLGHGDAREVQDPDVELR